MDELAVNLKGSPPRIVEVFSHLEVIEDLHDFLELAPCAFTECCG